MKFLDRGLELEDLRDAVHITGAKIEVWDWRRNVNAWKYFCGVCPKMLRDREEWSE